MVDIELRLNAQINDLREGLQVEVKNWLNGLATANDKARLAKEIIALANSGGGFIFIGFDDEESHPPIEPTETERLSFTQDNLSGLVNAYLSPPCQCELHFLRQREGTITHPVIIVPSEHRTPVFALRGAPKNGILDNGKVYVRRPGGNSEQARNQDDWERLLERLVKARQSDQLNAIREILSPSRAIDVTASHGETLDGWINECLLRWREKTMDLSDDDPRRFGSGYWYVAYILDSFQQPSLNALREQLDRQMPKYSGWPPFTYIHREDIRPQPFGDSIEAWMGADDDGSLSDYWRVTRDGKAFLLRPMQEDSTIYGSNINSTPPSPTFDWVLPIYRMTEVLKQVESFAQQNGGDDARFDLSLHYVGSAGRTLRRVDIQYLLGEQGPCTADTLSNRISASIPELEFNLNELLWKLLQPIYAQFDFAELERDLINRVVAQVNDNRGRF